MNQNILLSVGGRILFGMFIQWWVISTLGVTLTLTLIALIIASLVVGYQYGYIPKDKYYRYFGHLIRGYKVAKVIAQQYFDEEPPILFQINASGRSTSITYSHGGKQYLINLPYVPHLRPKMATKRAYLIRNNKEINITQQSGIPYLVTASELGGDKIIFKDLSDDVCKEFGKNEVPKI